MADTTTSKDTPPAVDQMIKDFWGLKLFVFPWSLNEAGVGAEIQLDSGGEDTTVGEFAGSDIPMAGVATGENEGVRKIKDGDCEGETSGDLKGESKYGDGVNADSGFKGGSDGGKGSESGGNEEGKGEDDGEADSLLSSLCLLAFNL